LYSFKSFTQIDRYELTYKFVDANNVSETDKINCVNTLKKRLTVFKDADVKLKSKNEIAVILNSGFEVKEVNKIVANSGRLDFWHCLQNDELLDFIEEADKKLGTNSIIKPISSLIKTTQYSQLSMVSTNDTLKIRQLLNDKRIANLYVEDFEYVKFLFGKPTENITTLYAVKSNAANRGIINEKSIRDVKQSFNQINNPSIIINMTTPAAKTWEKMTSEAFQNKTRIAIVFNDVVHSAPGVMSSISGGVTEISGSFTIEETQELVSILKGQSRIPKLEFIDLNKIVH